VSYRDLLRVFAAALLAKFKAGPTPKRRLGSHAYRMQPGARHNVRRAINLHGIQGSRRARYVGPNSYDSWKAELAAARAAKRAI